MSGGSHAERYESTASRSPSSKQSACLPLRFRPEPRMSESVGVSVVCRFRPLNEREREENAGARPFDVSSASDTVSTLSRYFSTIRLESCVAHRLQRQLTSTVVTVAPSTLSDFPYRCVTTRKLVLECGDKSGCLCCAGFVLSRQHLHQNEYLFTTVAKGIASPWLQTRK